MKKTVITHSSRFHADDVFAVASLSLVFHDEIEVTRTRDESKFAAADIVLDTGGENDPVRDRFDHHQKGGAGFHDNGIPYASFGLVWKKYGPLAIKAVAEKKFPGESYILEATFIQAVAHLIEKHIVCFIDANDNGIDTFDAKNGVVPYIIQDIVFAFGATWKEPTRSQDVGFFEMLSVAKSLLERVIIRATAEEQGKHIIDAIYTGSSDKRVLILDKNYSWDFYVQKYPDLLFVITPKTDDSSWGVHAVRIGVEGYANRKQLPLAWAGLRDADLAKVTGVADARFCHNARFLAVVGSLEGAKKLAELALTSD